MASMNLGAGIQWESGYSSNEKARKGPVVIVDDDAIEAVQMEGIIDTLRPRCQAQILTSGEDLVAYLKGENLYSDRDLYPYPGVVLLDLQMPNMNGLDVLLWLQDHREHAHVPVVVLSEWVGIARHVTKARQLGALSFLPKPVQPHDVHGVFSLLKISV